MRHEDFMKKVQKNAAKVLKKYGRKRAFPPAEGSEEREGWDRCLDIPSGERQNQVRDIIRMMDEPGMRSFTSGWMDAYDTFGEASWDEINSTLSGD